MFGYPSQPRSVERIDNYSTITFPLAVLTLAVFSSGFNGLRIATNATIGDAFLLLVAAIWLLSFPLRRHAPLHRTSIYALMLFFLAFLIESVLNDGSKSTQNFYEFVKFVTSFFIVTYLVLDYAKRQGAVKLLVAAYVASGVTNAAIGIADMFGITEFSAWLNVQTVDSYIFHGRAYGLTAHPNHLAQHCTMALFLLIAFVNEKDKLAKRFLTIFVAAILFLGISIAGSRGALVSMIIVVLCVGFFYWGVKRLARKTHVVLFFGFLIVGTYFFLAESNSSGEIDWAGYRLISAGEDVIQSNLERIHLYGVAWQDVKDHPIIGSGFNNINRSHNIYLQVLHSSGLIGIVALSLYFVGPGLSVIRGFRVGYVDNLTIGIVSAVGVFLISGIVENMIYVRFTLIPVGFLWAVTRMNRLNYRNTKQYSIAAASRF